MKIAVLSCIHGNLPALEAVLKDIEKHNCDRIFQPLNKLHNKNSKK